MTGLDNDMGVMTLEDCMDQYKHMGTTVQISAGHVIDTGKDCTLCGRHFDMKEIREMKGHFNNRRDGFICPDCCDSLLRMPLEHS